MNGKPLETVLADWREIAQTFRRAGQGPQAELVERIAAEVAAAAEDYMRKLSEEEAMNWSGKSRDWLKHRFPEWEVAGHAGQEGRKRWYRAVVVPHRINPDQIRADARREAAA